MSQRSAPVRSYVPRFCATATSCPEQCDQAPHLLIFLRCESLLKPAKSPIDSLHRLLCLFGDCGAERSTSSDIELVTTFSGEKNWSIIATGLLVVLWASAHRSQRLIAVSEATRADLLHYYRLPPERITVIPHGVRPRIFARRKRDFRLRAGRDSRLSYPLAGDIDHGAELSHCEHILL
jgi:hypothetical protein